MKYFGSQDMSVELVAETARRCPLPLNKKQTPLASSWLLGEQISREAEAIAKNPRFVLCDRAVPDIISHTTVLESFDEAQRDIYDAVIGMGGRWIRTYECIFWARLDPGRPVEPDGYRIADKEYQILLERSLSEVFKRYDAKPIALPQETQDRLGHVIAYLEQDRRDNNE